jgi:N-acetylmuramoyl-L-alanine amidase
MREIKYIVIHCTATKPSQDIGVSEIDEWHKARGWKGVGYHFVVRRDGTVERGRMVEEIGAHAHGYNLESVGVAMVGGVNDEGKPDCNYTREQWAELDWLIAELQARFPDAEVIGHRDLPGVSKACPCFDAIAWADQ